MKKTPAFDISELPPNDVLRAMYATEVTRDSEGRERKATSGLSRKHVIALYRMIHRHRPRRVLEIGLAYGYSTLAILTALHELGEGGRLISVDPFQTRDWRNIGLENIRRSGLGTLHELIEKPSHLALPSLIDLGQQQNFIFVDGNHAFEHAAIDLLLSDQLLPVGGIIGFDNCGWLGVFHALRVLRRLQRYEELDAGLAPDYRARNLLLSLARRIMGWRRENRYFRRTRVEHDYGDGPSRGRWEWLRGPRSHHHG